MNILLIVYDINVAAKLIVARFPVSASTNVIIPFLEALRARKKNISSELVKECLSCKVRDPLCKTSAQSIV